MEIELADDVVRLSRRAVRFPVELRAPPGFAAADPATWPRVDGRLEYVGGRLLYMPPCGDVQQDICPDVMLVLRAWTEDHPDFLVGGNEAGMLLGGEVRGADGAVWRRDAVGARSGGYRRVPPVLAVEVAGQDEGERELREKARWYLDHGVLVIWLILADAREVVVLTVDRDTRHRTGALLPPHPALPGLAPAVDRFFAQLGR